MVPLDEDRVLSMADEGGVSAATVEAQPDSGADRAPHGGSRWRRLTTGAALGLMAGIALYAIRRRG
jgi:hypothetical protein